MASRFSDKSPSARPLRVGEEIRHTLAEILMRGEAHIAEIDGVSITVSEVRVSPDLKNASVYITTLGGLKLEETFEALVANAPRLRAEVSRKVTLKYMPKLNFKLDRSFDEAGRINVLLQDPNVRRDVSETD